MGSIPTPGTNKKAHILWIYALGRATVWPASHGVDVAEQVGNYSEEYDHSSKHLRKVARAGNAHFTSLSCSGCNDITNGYIIKSL